MIKSANLAKEITVRVINKIGVLADISGVLSEKGINITAVNGYAVENVATIRIVTSNNREAVEALKNSGYADCKEKEIILVELEDQVGALKNITTKLATAGIDILHVYGSACSGGCPAKIIFSTSDNAKVLTLFK